MPAWRRPNCTGSAIGERAELTKWRRSGSTCSGSSEETPDEAAPISCRPAGHGEKRGACHAPLEALHGQPVLGSNHHVADQINVAAATAFKFLPHLDFFLVSFPAKSQSKSSQHQRAGMPLFWFLAKLEVGHGHSMMDHRLKRKPGACL